MRTAQSMKNNLGEGKKFGGGFPFDPWNPGRGKGKVSIEDVGGNIIVRGRITLVGNVGNKG